MWAWAVSLSPMTKVILGGILLLLFTKWMMRKKANLPPGPFPLPLIGNLHSFWRKSVSTVVDGWRQKYGPIMTVHLGPMKAVVVTDLDLITDAMVKQDSAFSGRPYVYCLDRFTEGSKNIAIASYGEVWKLQKKIASQALRLYISGDKLEERIHEVMDLVIASLEKEKTTGPIAFHLHTSLTLFNFFHGLCFGKTLAFEDPTFRRLIKAFDTFQTESENGFIEDVVPFMRLWPTRHFTNVLNAMMSFLEYIHNQMNARREVFDENVLTCLADNIILARRQCKNEGREDGIELDDIHVNHIVSDVFGGGMDTTRSTLDWIFLVLVTRPEIQARMQEEIDEVLGDHNIPRREHRHRLAYSEAVIFETMRMYPVTPYGLPHSTMCDTTLAGYDIPKGTIFIPGMLCTLRDPEVWKDPLEFRPERFLDDSQTRLVSPKRFIPFSMGHRSCPGEGLAKLQMLYFVVTLLQKYNFSLPPGENIRVEDSISGFSYKAPQYNVTIKNR